MGTPYTPEPGTTVAQRGVLGSTGGSITDFKVAGFGIPDWGIFISTSVDDGNSSDNDSTPMIGFFDGTNYGSAGVYSQNGVTTTSCRQIYRTDSIRTLDSSFVGSCGFELDPVETGYEMEVVFDNTSRDQVVGGIMSTGYNCLVTKLDLTSGTGLTKTISGIGFTPKAVIVLQVDHGDPTFGGFQGARYSYGAAQKDVGQWCAASDFPHGDTTTRCSKSLRDDCVAQTLIAGVEDWRVSVSAWGADSIDFFYDVGNPGNIDLLVMILGEDADVQVGEIVTPGAGSTTVTESVPDFVPHALLGVVTTATSKNTIITNDDATGMALGVADNTRSNASSVADGDNLTTTVCKSYDTANKFLDLKYCVGSTETDIATVEVDFFEEEFDLVYSANTGSDRYGFYVAFGPGVPVNGNPFYYYQYLLGR